jgi:DNA modification methylase
MEQFINKVIQGDCLEKLKELEDNSVDSIVTDPPYELGFMGKSWDNTGIANNKDMWAECLRVLKPGGHLLSFSGTRTYHRMASAIEDAGFEVRDMIEWVYGSGFPKSRNIGLDVDKRNGVTKNRGKAFVVAGQSGQRDKDTGGDLVPGSNTMGAYIAQNEWSGWGTALKPSHEPICMARKPLAEKTVAENCLKYGTGGINIDESRVDYNGETPNIGGRANHTRGDGYGFKELGDKIEANTQGRFPANLIHDNSEEVRECFPETKSGKMGPQHTRHTDGSPNGIYGKFDVNHELGETYGDSGNASRFFKSIIYQAKASKSERNKGCEELEEKVRVRQGLAGEHKDTLSSNSHPTVKPIALMEYLIKMVTKPGGIVLDPFAGSGSTLVAAKQNGFNYIGIEMTEEYIPIIQARLDTITQQTLL